MTKHLLAMATSSPFSPSQRILIVCVAGVFVLGAIGNLIKAFHPRFRRGGQFRYTPLAFVLLSMIVAIECFIVVNHFNLVARYALWLPVGAIFGLIMLFCCAGIDERHETRRAAAQAVRWQPSESSVVRLAQWYARLLALSLFPTLFSLYGELFGPQWGIGFVIVGFVLAMSVFMLSRHPLGLRFLQICPGGLCGHFSRLALFKKPIEFSLSVSGLCAFLAIAMMFVSQRRAGGPADSAPAFAQRERYVLSSHGKRTEVSALRFRAAAAGGLIGWHSGAVCASLLALYALLYGELPRSFKKGNTPPDVGGR